ncbi:MAG: hypothetical protein ACR2Q3_10095 [Woeseiaceae bacterium]
MSEILIFTLNGIFIYLVSDWIVRKMEARLGEVLKYRQVVFFAIFLSLALATFQMLRLLLQGT